MNLLLLLAGVRVWMGTPVQGVTRVLLAVSLLSLEMQLATWSGGATLSGVEVARSAVLYWARA